MTQQESVGIQSEIFCPTSEAVCPKRSQIVSNYQPFYDEQGLPIVDETGISDARKMQIRLAEYDARTLLNPCAGPENEGICPIYLTMQKDPARNILKGIFKRLRSST